MIGKIKPSIGLVFAIDPTNKIYGKGSGFVIEPGILVTCNHVVAVQSANILLQFPDSDEKIAAKVAIRDEEHDLALLKFDKKEIKSLRICKQEEIKEGMAVIFAGYPLDLLSLTTHQGILSTITTDDTGNTVYLIDGTVNSGNSGCPLMNEQGEVIGIVNAKRREQSDLLSEVEKLKSGAISIHGIDMISIYKALIENLQLGIGYAVPSVYIPKRQEVK
ncbi:MAG: trypsin-like peptidase domain-containing protein [Candidatus Levybacteria bacterium]|nr:trypsin-like peptidase domain-containing protein [Candidatus Levybacteria bacterium]